MEQKRRLPAMGEIRTKALLENETDVVLRKAGKLGRRKVRALELRRAGGSF